MNDLRRELAPISEAAWEEIEEQAKLTLKGYLAGRKLVDFEGPLGWQHSAVSLGRVERYDEQPIRGVEAQLRLVQPMVELRVPFELSRDELDCVSRGAADPDLDALEEAARQLALAEDHLVFQGFPTARVSGLVTGSAQDPIDCPGEGCGFPDAISAAVAVLRESGIEGPFALALNPKWHSRLYRATEGGGYPVIRHVRGVIDGPIVWAPGLTGGLVLSMRGGDFQLVVGRDVSIGYLDHDRSSVRLYFEESVTFRLLTPEAVVSLRATG